MSPFEQERKRSNDAILTSLTEWALFVGRTRVERAGLRLVQIVVAPGLQNFPAE